MKTNKYANLIKFGFTPKTLMTLSESDINKLHKSLIESKKEVCPKCKKGKCECNENKKKETKEQTTKTSTTTVYNLTDKTQLSKANQAIKSGGNASISDDRTKLTLVNGAEEEGKEQVEGKAKNPWAICHAQVGPKKTKKFERCVRAVKASMKENKLPFDRILENKILSLVEKHLRPKMSKGDLMNLVGKKKMNLPIGKLGSIGGVTEEETKTKPKVKPTTKPGEKKPLDPFKPSPDKKPAPKAKKSETKEQVMDAPAPVKEPTTRPTTKPGEKPVKPLDPFRPDPSKQPAPKARKKMPEWLKFNNLGIKFKK